MKYCLVFYVFIINLYLSLTLWQNCNSHLSAVNHMRRSVNSIVTSDRAFLKPYNLDCLTSEPSSEWVSGSFLFSSFWEILGVFSCVGSCFLGLMSSSFLVYYPHSGDHLLQQFPDLVCLKMLVSYPCNWLVVWLGKELKVENDFF